jgi:hypothetical protein
MRSRLAWPRVYVKTRQLRGLIPVPAGADTPRAALTKARLAPNNGSVSRLVPARRRAALRWAVLAAVLVPACLQIDGGSIELSWVTYCAGGHPPSSGSSSCSCKERAAALASVQLVLNPLGDGGGGDFCAGRSGCRFAAGHQSGNTAFFVPPGDYDISLLPLDASGAPLGGPGCIPGTDDAGTPPCWQSPAPLRRTVLKGEVVSLGSFLFSVPDCPVTDTCAKKPGATDTCP